MSERYRSGDVVTTLVSPCAGERTISQWASLRRAMIRTRPEDFTRDEWAYLIGFLDGDNLRMPFTDTFGELTDSPAGSGTATAGSEAANRVATPVARVALWLPNNVSLLGPLTMVLISLAGCRLRVKAGSKANNLTAAFRDFALEKLEEGGLKEYLADSVQIEEFDRTDPRNAELSKESDVRILFGGDQAASAIDALPHPPSSKGFYFVDKRSEAWVDADALEDSSFQEELLRVFAIYGQAGCTSPKRVVIIGGTEDDAKGFVGKLAERWSETFKALPPQNLSSLNFLAHQITLAKGGYSTLARNNAAHFTCDRASAQPMESQMTLAVQWGTLEEALATMPGNIQTVGYRAASSQSVYWLAALADSAAKRAVPVARMHHFSHVWDGMPFWANLFHVEKTC